jgi:hypothetical protein
MIVQAPQARYLGQRQRARAQLCGPVFDWAVLWVPKTSSTSCDLRVFIDDAAKAIAPLDVEMI